MATTSGAVTFSGFNGIDFSAVITAIMQQASTPLNNLQQQQQTVKNQQAAYTQLGSQISNLETDTANILSSDSFTQVTATSSDPTVVSTAGGNGAIPGHYDIQVTNTAKPQVTTSSSSYSSPSDIVADGGSISFSSVTPPSTPVPAIQLNGPTTLSQLKDAINAQQSGVVASIVNTGSAYKLVISSRTTGVVNGFTVNDSLTSSTATPPLAFAAGQSPATANSAGTGNTQDAGDAAIKVNSLDITSSSNTIDGAIPGISFTVMKNGNAAVDVAASYSDLENSISSLVSDYNHLRNFATSQQTADGNGNRGPLANDSVLRQVTSDLGQAMLQVSGTVGTGTWNYLSQIGIEVSRTGTLTFNQKAFESAVAADPNGVAKLFQGTASNGIFNTITDDLQGMDATSGLLKTTQDSLSSTVKAYASRINDQQTRLDAYKASLQQQFAAAQSAMTALQQQGTSLTSLSNSGQ